MAEAKKSIMTQAGVDELEEELRELKVNERKRVAQDLKEARDQGDLSENAEYDAAKKHQRKIEDRINELEELLKNVEVVSSENLNGDVVSVGAHVKLMNITRDKEVEYSIVGVPEADLFSGKISNESPIGAAVMGAHTGEVVTAETPAGQQKFKVLSISFM